MFSQSLYPVLGTGSGDGLCWQSCSGKKVWKDIGECPHPQVAVLVIKHLISQVVWSLSSHALLRSHHAPFASVLEPHRGAWVELWELHWGSVPELGSPSRVPALGCVCCVSPRASPPPLLACEGPAATTVCAPAGLIPRQRAARDKTGFPLLFPVFCRLFPSA